MSAWTKLRWLFASQAPAAPAAPPPAPLPITAPLPPSRSPQPDMLTTLGSESAAFAFDALARMFGNSRPKGQSDANPFAVQHRPPPGVPTGSGMAMDSAPGGVAAWAMSGLSGFLGPREGFIGFPELALLAQRPEYRSPAEIIASEACRKWVKLNGPDADRIAKIEAEFERLQVRSAFHQVSMHDSLYGRGHIYIDVDGALDDADELLSSIGAGDALSKLKIGRGSLKALRTVEPVWCWPIAYNSIDPLNAQWYRPETWFCMSKEVHRTRLLTFIAREVPDLLKPAYMFGGQSLTQQLMPVVDNWLRTRKSVGDIIQKFSVNVIKANLAEALNSGNAGKLFQRVRLFTQMKNNGGAMLLDRETEDFINVSVPLAGLSELQAQSQEHMSSLSRIPLIKLAGIQPAGLNATSEGELRAFEETIKSYQEAFFRPHLTTIFNLVQLNLFGEVDPKIGFDFVPLTQELDEREKAEAAEKVTTGAANAFEVGIIDRATALRQIREQLDGLGIRSVIDDKMIAEAEEGPPTPSPEELRAEAEVIRAENEGGEGGGAFLQ